MAEIINGEAETECWKYLFSELLKYEWKEEEIDFRIISCSDKEDGAKIFLHPRMKNLIEKHFIKKNKLVDSILFGEKEIWVKMDCGKGLAYISYLISLILTDPISDKRKAMEERRRKVMNEKAYLKENIDTLLHCFSEQIKKKKGKIQVSIFYKSEEKRYYVTIKIRWSKRKTQIIKISDHYSRRIIGKVSKLFFQ